jgi:hypothetical protein
MCVCVCVCLCRCHPTHRTPTPLPHALGIGHQIELIAKLEAYDCLQHLDAIVQAADGIMVARGDLGAQVRFVLLWGGGRHTW